MATTIDPQELKRRVADLEAENAALARRYPGDASGRQAVHTVYGGAHLFSATTAAKLGELARRSLAAYAPEAASLAVALGLPGSDTLPADGEARARLAEAFAADPAALRERQPAAWLAHAVYARVVEKLEREPVEDFRIDFEDGYGNRPDGEEDGHAVAAAAEVARGMEEGSLPPFLGIRIKPFSDELVRRSARTLDLFLTALVERTRAVAAARGDGSRPAALLPDGFVVTLPKVTHTGQVVLLADLLASLETALGLDAGALAIELMVETPQSILGADGTAALPRLVAAAGRRCRSAHFGTYDYTASLGITAAHQHMAHPVCDFAKHVMQVSLAGSGIFLSDGATNVLPVAPHRVGKDGSPLSAAEEEENRRVVHQAWRTAYRHTRHSLETGFYQGWDLHPGQLPVRYAAMYAFFLDGVDAAADRLRNFVAKAAQATLVGDLFDDAATGQGLLNYFLRAVACGALSEEEAIARSGLTAAELSSRSFLAILASRRGG